MNAPRTIFITGAAQGIGRAMALHLAAPGTRLLLHYRKSRAQAEALAEQVRAKGAGAELLRADLANLAEREALLEQLREKTTALQVLINNVGVYDGRGLLEFEPEDWQRIFDASCSAVFHLISRTLPLLRAGTPARIINLGDSGNDRVIARPTATPYHIAKLGVHVLTRSYAKLLAGDGITVNQISPGFLDNSLGEPGSTLPAGRKGGFADILPALDYLLSAEAAYVTGANIVVAGGWNL
ncbi:MAG: SDR family oxidoreductase [SAR324 cluster bacterium]|nr:SDR family oxidoreductase [SAR324 cluster bacterium]MCZ6646313.1 SDR family oxidoreductase [SAR324 cluster bacterium]